MTPIEKDEFSHALGQTLAFYGKTLDKAQFGFWYQGFANYPLKSIKTALLQYTKVGKYAPKPVNIHEIMDANRSLMAPERTLPTPPPKPCPPDIARAWMWFIG
ncbi:MAG: hypothetical protein ACR2PH_12155, partial [Desulfobulbia bacterium]